MAKPSPGHKHTIELRLMHQRAPTLESTRRPPWWNRALNPN
jgi:hypothetical protein